LREVEVEAPVIVVFVVSARNTPLPPASCCIERRIRSRAWWNRVSSGAPSPDTVVVSSGEADDEGGDAGPGGG
jgi:hypothetical protein